MKVLSALRHWCRAQVPGGGRCFPLTGDADAVGDVRVDRRTFLYQVSALLALPSLIPRHCGRARLDVSHLHVHPPHLVLFPECRPGRRVVSSHCGERTALVRAFTREPGGGVVEVEFSSGRRLRFSSSTSSGTAASLREGMAVKRLSAWTLAGLQEAGGGLHRRDYESLQRQEVMERVTLGTLCDLLEQVRGRPEREVAWDERRARLVTR
jgi:hypothetical protein